MRKKDLERTLRKLGCKFEREGGNHEIWSRGNYRFPVPRHREIRKGTARAIINQLKKVTESSADED